MCNFMPYSPCISQRHLINASGDDHNEVEALTKLLEDFFKLPSDSELDEDKEDQ